MRGNGGRNGDIFVDSTGICDSRRIAPNVCSKTLCCPRMRDDIEEFASRRREFKVKVISLLLCRNRRRVFTPVWYSKR